MNINTFKRFSFLAIFFSIILLPIFCLPFTNIPLETSKGLLLVLGLTVSFIFWGFTRFFDGKITIPRSVHLFTAFCVVCILFISTIFSKSPQVSLFGTMFDLGSFYFIFACVLLMFMCAITFRDHKDTKKLFYGLAFVSFVVLLFQSIHLFMPSVLSLGLLRENTSNLIGSWNIFGVFTGLFALLSLILLEFFSNSRIIKVFLSLSIALSLSMLMVVNFSLSWQLLGIFSLIIFIYKASLAFGEDEEGKVENVFPYASFFVTVVALVFFIGGNFIGNILPSRLGIINNEISPSFGSTMLVTKSVLNSNPVLGIGPNQFSNAWSMYKPLVINNTQFWDVSFNSGFGLFPTFMATTGLAGIMVYFIFFITFLILGFKFVSKSIKNKIQIEGVVAFILALYLVISSFFYASGSVNLILLFAFAGVFVGMSHHTKDDIVFSLFNNHKRKIFSIFFIVCTIIFALAVSFKYIQRFMAVSYLGKTLSANNVESAKYFINKAVQFYPNDLNLRTYSSVYLFDLNSLVKKPSLSDEDKVLMQVSLDNAISGAGLATQYDNNNYLNFLTLGSVYQGAGSIGVKDSYEKALENYKISSNLNPRNPGIKLAIANILNILENKKDAKDYAHKAINLKSDYVDAFVLLSQISKSEGNTNEAISYAEKALSFAPLNESLIKYVSSLKNPTPSLPVENSNKN
jgi:hypothetical protein